jgi:hypothetical protein
MMAQQALGEAAASREAAQGLVTDARRQAAEQAMYAQRRRDTLADTEASRAYEMQRDAEARAFQTQRDAMERMYRAQQDAAKDARRAAEDEQERARLAERAQNLARATGVPSGPTPAVLPFGGAGQAATFDMPLPELTDPSDVQFVASLREREARGGRANMETDWAAVQDWVRRVNEAETPEERLALQVEGRLRYGLPMPMTDPDRQDREQRRIDVAVLKQQRGDLTMFKRALSSRNVLEQQTASKNLVAYLEKRPELSEGIDLTRIVTPRINTKTGNPVLQANGQPQMDVDIQEAMRVLSMVSQRIDQASQDVPRQSSGGQSRGQKPAPGSGAEAFMREFERGGGR